MSFGRLSRGLADRQCTELPRLRLRMTLRMRIRLMLRMRMKLGQVEDWAERGPADRQCTDLPGQESRTGCCPSLLSRPNTFLSTIPLFASTSSKVLTSPFIKIANQQPHQWHLLVLMGEAKAIFYPGTKVASMRDEGE